jgi:polyhydroxyalkanoate synthesis regulator phasin
MPQPKKTGSSSSRKPAARKPAAARKTAAKPAAARKTTTAPGRKTAAKPAAARKTTTTRKSTTARKPTAARKPAGRRATATKRTTAAANGQLRSVPTTPEEVVANLNMLRERLVSSLTLTTERLQETVDDAVRRGRMTRKDAEELLATLVSAGKAQTEALLAEVESLLGRGNGGVRERAAESSDAVLRTVDRARRRVGVGTFPILNYDDLTAAQITKRLGSLGAPQLRKVRDHERRTAGRKSILAAIQRQLTS